MTVTNPSFDKKERRLIIKEAIRCENAGKLTQPMLELAREKKLFHSAVPHELGGHQMDILPLMELFEKASRLDGSFGWLITLGAGAGIFAAYMEPSFASRIFTQPAAFIAGSGYPSGRAIPQNGSYIIDGKWKYASGTPHATLFTASCIVARKKSEEPEIRAMAFFPDEIFSKNTWHSYGLKATASQNFEVNGVQLPEERTFLLQPREPYADDTLYRFPFEPFATASLSSCMLGITFRFLEEASVILKSKSAEAWEFAFKCEEEIKRKKMTFLQSIEELWEICGSDCRSDFMGESSKRVNHAAIELTGSCRQRSFDLYIRCGTQVLPENEAINRAWRDLMTAGQHVMLQSR